MQVNVLGARMLVIATPHCMAQLKRWGPKGEMKASSSPEEFIPNLYNISKRPSLSDSCQCELYSSVGGGVDSKESWSKLPSCCSSVSPSPCLPPSPCGSFSVFIMLVRVRLWKGFCLCQRQFISFPSRSVSWTRGRETIPSSARLLSHSAHTTPAGREQSCLVCSSNLRSFGLCSPGESHY